MLPVAQHTTVVQNRLGSRIGAAVLLVILLIIDASGVIFVAVNTGRVLLWMPQSLDFVAHALGLLAVIKKNRTLGLLYAVFGSILFGLYLLGVLFLFLLADLLSEVMAQTGDSSWQAPIAIVILVCIAIGVMRVCAIVFTMRSVPTSFRNTTMYIPVPSAAPLNAGFPSAQQQTYLTCATQPTNPFPQPCNPMPPQSSVNPC